jgi:PAS domain-containing protein
VLFLHGSNIEQSTFIQKVLDFTRAGLIVTDPSLPDNPIIYANKGFSDMTGYKMEHIIGENCRFLQGEMTNPTTVKELKKLSIIVHRLMYKF